MAAYTRNIQGKQVILSLEDVDPDNVLLDPSNPRIGFSMRQLAENERTDAACALLLISQEETETLRRSIALSNGVQEPIYLRADGRVAEGNRRVVALRALKEEFPGDERFSRMPAWRIPADTAEEVIQNLLNEIHLGAVRGWAPYEKALQMQALVDGGLMEDEVAERYRMTTREVKQQLAAIDLMNRLYFPITADPSDPEHRSKFSYFLEFQKNGRIQAHSGSIPDLTERFAAWVRDGKIDTGARVRRLPKILDSEEATRLLEVVGCDAAEEYLAKQNPDQQELYAMVERMRSRLDAMTVNELIELRGSRERQEILRNLERTITQLLKTLSGIRKVS